MAFGWHPSVHKRIVTSAPFDHNREIHATLKLGFCPPKFIDDKLGDISPLNRNTQYFIMFHRLNFLTMQLELSSPYEYILEILVEGQRNVRIDKNH